MTSIARPRVFLDVSIDAVPTGRLVFELFTDKAPKTCENFRQLCTTGYRGKTYAGTPFHRVIDEFMIQGGDIEHSDGTGTISIYGGREFDDENLAWRDIDASGLLCSANRGANTNGSQFFVTLEPTPHLNGKHTVFGRVLGGEDVLRSIASTAVNDDDRPVLPVLIARCGELEQKRKRNRSVDDRGRTRGDTDQTTVSSSRTVPADEDVHRLTSDRAIDEGLRGRPRKRSRDRAGIRHSADVTTSTERSPAHLHKRKRSSSPSRDRRPEDHGDGTGRRRRRSLPNQYDDDRHNDRTLRSHDHDNVRRSYGHDNTRWSAKARGNEPQDHRSYDQYGRSQRHRPSRFGHTESWTSRDTRPHGDSGSSTETGVKFKGRGVMKYREPGRLT